MRSPFEVLRIDPGAGDGEIREAYRRRIKEAHPDQGGSFQEFQSVMAAYEELRSRRSRSGDGTSPGAGDRRSAERDGTGDGHRRAWSGFGEREREWNDGSHRGVRSRVEYIDYEVLDDFGWTLDDDDLFEKASAEDLDATDHGRILVRSHESLLEAAEGRGFRWPYACRGGACANCAVAVAEGDLAMPANHILPPEMVERGVRLSCNGVPTTERMKVVYNLKRRPDLDDLRLPPHRFERDYLSD